MPAKIWGFLDLWCLPTNSGVSFGGVDNLYPAVYAVVESATYSTNMTEINMSDIFVPIVKEVGRVTNGEVSGLKFYLAEVEAFTVPLTVIPDIGGNPNAYFVVKNRKDRVLSLFLELTIPTAWNSVLPDLDHLREIELVVSTERWQQGEFLVIDARRSFRCFLTPCSKAADAVPWSMRPTIVIS